MSVRSKISDKGISVVLGTYNRKKFLLQTIESIRNELKIFEEKFEIIVIDGGSDDGTIQWLAQQKDIITIIQHNHGSIKGEQVSRRSWGYFMNLGFKVAQGKYICMLSDDCLVVPGAIINGYNYFEQLLSEDEKIGSLAFYWRNFPEMKNYWVGLTLGNKMFVNHGMFLKTALIEVDFIDEDNYNFYHADGDLCLKLWDKDYKCVDSKLSFIEHFSHAGLKTRKSNLDGQKSDFENYKKKWEGKFYNSAVNNEGSWLKLDFDDEYKTADKFKDVSFFKYIIIKYFFPKARKIIKN